MPKGPVAKKQQSEKTEHRQRILLGQSLGFFYSVSLRLVHIRHSTCPASVLASSGTLTSSVLKFPNHMCMEETHDCHKETT